MMPPSAPTLTARFFHDRGFDVGAIVEANLLEPAAFAARKIGRAVALRRRALETGRIVTAAMNTKKRNRYDGAMEST
jgi:hypothetical protein